MGGSKPPVLPITPPGKKALFWPKKYIKTQKAIDHKGKTAFIVSKMPNKLDVKVARGVRIAAN
jgi:hypothetical protein